MVLYKDKVYNIQIRYQEESQVYLLGTGLRGKEVRTSGLKMSPMLGFRFLCTLMGCLPATFFGILHVEQF